MKTTLAIIITTAALAAAPFAYGQDTDPRIRRIPVPPSRNQQPPVPQDDSGSAAELLTNNVAITLAGTVGDDIPLDVTLTGCASRMTSDIVIAGGEVPTIARVSYLIGDTDGKFTITYEVGLRIPVVTSRSGDQKNISFQDASLRNTVRCAPGKPVEIYKSGKNSLTLTIAEAATD